MCKVTSTGYISLSSKHINFSTDIAYFITVIWKDHKLYAYRLSAAAAADGDCYN